MARSRTKSRRDVQWFDLVAVQGEGSDGEILLMKAISLYGTKDIRTYEREQHLLAGRKIRADFVWRRFRLIAEIDGGQWMKRTNARGETMVGGRHNRDADRFRNNDLVADNWRILHFTAEMLRADPERCMQQILKACATYNGMDFY